MGVYLRIGYLTLNDEEFLDLIYAHWAKTTDAETSYLMPEAYTDHSGRWRVYAVSQGDVIGDDGSGRATAPSNETRKLVADQMSEADADFYTAICGCLPDLVRRLHMAIDESSRLDTERDEFVGRIAELEMLVDDLRADVNERDREIGDLLVKIPEENL